MVMLDKLVIGEQNGCPSRKLHLGMNRTDSTLLSGRNHIEWGKNSGALVKLRWQELPDYCSQRRRRATGWARRGRFLLASAAIGMMQAVEDRCGQETSVLRWVWLSGQARVAGQRLMASMFVVIANILIEDLPKAAFVQHDQTIQAFPTDGTDHAFDIGILPRRSECGANLLDAQGLHRLSELGAIDAVVVAQQESRRRIIGEGLDDLESRPISGWVRRHVDVQDSSILVSKKNEYIEHSERDRRHDEEIAGDDLIGVVG